MYDVAELMSRYASGMPLLHDKIKFGRTLIPLAHRGVGTLCHGLILCMAVGHHRYVPVARYWSTSDGWGGRSRQVLEGQQRHHTRVRVPSRAPLIDYSLGVSTTTYLMMGAV